MRNRVHCVPAFEDNYIWLAGSADGNGIVIVDPGDDGPVIAAIDRLALAPNAILVTHHHGDHTGGIAELAARYRIPVHGPRRISAVTDPVAESDRLEIAGLSLRVMETPGHTRDHVCYYGEGILFSGDTLFTAGCGRLFEGTPGQMHDSLERIAALPDDTLVYCAHEYTLANLAFARVAEPDNKEIVSRLAEAQALRKAGQPTVPATLALEKRTNPFLRCHVPALVQGAERFAGRRTTGGTDVFAVVRHWKDTLD